jgi:membrane protease YdiL (CAAX protease family)
MQTNQQRILLRAVATCFLIAFVIELFFRPFGELLALANLVDTPRDEIRLHVYDLILVLIALLAICTKAQWPLILASNPARLVFQGVLVAFPFVSSAGLLAVALSGFSLRLDLGSVVIFTLLGWALYVALAEELLLRGLLQQWLEIRLAPLQVVWLQAVLFSLLHLPGRGLNLFLIIFYFAAGAVFTLLVYRWRTVWMPVGVHFTWDSVVFFLQGADVRGRSLPGVLSEDAETAVAISSIVGLLVALVLLVRSVPVKNAVEGGRAYRS